MAMLKQRKAIKKEVNPFTTLMNLFLCFLRACFFFYFVKILWVVFFHRVAKFFSQKHGSYTESLSEIYVSLFLFSLLAGAFYDLICGGSYFVGYGTFNDHIKLGKFVRVLGLSGSWLDVLLVRLTIYFSIWMATQFKSFHFSSFYIFLEGKFSNLGDEIKFFSSETFFFICIFLYFFVSILWTPLSWIWPSLEHPWIASYNEDPITKPMKNVFSKFLVGLFIFNASTKFFVLGNLFHYYINGNTQEDFWIPETSPRFMILMAAAIISMLLVREAYIIIRMNHSESVKSTFVINSLHLTYLVALVTTELNYLDKVVLLRVILMVLLINLVVYIVSNPLRSVNLMIFLFKKVTSQSFLSALAITAFYITATSAGYFFNISYTKKWFSLEVKFSDAIAWIVELAKKILSFLKKVISLFVKAVSAILNSEASIALCILIIVLLVVAIAMSFLPFGTGSGSYVSYNIPKIFRKFMKFVKILKRLSSNLISIRKYAKRFQKFLDKIKSVVDVKELMGGVVFLMLQTPLVVAAVCFSIAFIVRTSKVGKMKIAAFVALSAVSAAIVSSFLLMIKFILVREINLILIRAGFKTTRHFHLLIVSFMLTFLSLICFVVHLLMGKNISSEKLKSSLEVDLRDASKKNNLLEERPPIEIDDNYGKEMVYDTYLCKDLCCRSNIKKSKEPKLRILKLILMKMACRKNTDRRTVCKYPADKMFPCQHADEREDCCRKPRPLKICKKEIDFDLNEKFENVSRFGRLGLVLPYLAFCAIILYMVYLSFHAKWYKQKTSLDPFIIAILGDKGPDANKKQVTSQNKEQGSACKSIIQVLIVSVIAKFISEFFSFILGDFKNLKENLEKMVQMLKSSDSTINLGKISKIVLLTPVVYICGIVIIAKVLTSLYKNNDIVFLALITGVGAAFNGAFLLMIFHYVINGVFEAIPFVKVKFSVLEGWKTGVMTYLLTIVMLGFFAVDYFAPPVSANLPLDLAEQLEIEDSEEKNTLGFDMKRSQEVFVNNLFHTKNSDEISFDE